MSKIKQTSIDNLDDGKIALDRAIMRHWIANDPVEFIRWVDMIMLAAYKPKQFRVNNHIVNCDRGQFATTNNMLSIRWKVTRDSVKPFLDLLKKSHMIDTEGTSHFTRITICNYDNYQFTPHTKNTPETQVTTHKQHTSNTPKTHITNKERIEIIKNNKEYNIIIKELEKIVKTKKGEPGGGEKLFIEADNMLSTVASNFDLYKKLGRLIMDARAIQNTKQNTKITEQVFPGQQPLTYFQNQLDDLAKELESSDAFHIQVCLSVKNKNNIDVDAEFVKQKIPEFIQLITEQGNFPVELDKKKTHFENWINKTIKYSNNGQRGIYKGKSGSKRGTNLVNIEDAPENYGRL